MIVESNVKAILEKAIKREIESRLLYIELSQKMKDEAAKEAFQQLAGQEQEHQNYLERYKRGELMEGVLRSGQVIDYKIAEKLDQEPVSSEMTLKDTFLLAEDLFHDKVVLEVGCTLYGAIHCLAA